jgi:peroxiredoxin
VSDCQSKFPVAADSDGAVMKAWGTTIPLTTYANRTSYVINPDGKIIYAFTDMSPDHHVENTLNAVKLWKVSR